METKINSKKENKLLFRTEIEGELSFDKATPSYNELTKELSSKLKVEEDLVAVKNIKTSFGSSSAKFLANVYATKENKEKIELKKKVKVAAEGEQPAKAA